MIRDKKIGGICIFTSVKRSVGAREMALWIIKWLLCRMRFGSRPLELIQKLGEHGSPLVILL